MDGLRAGKRYARALFDQAKEDQVLDSVQQDLSALSAVADASEAFAAFLQNPLVSPVEREAVFGKVAEGADPLTTRFLKFLESKKRVSILPAISQVFQDLYRDEKGILNVHITAAHALSEQQVDQLKERLKNNYNKEIEADVAVDASLIGGFRIQVGDQIEDFSIASKLERFKQRVLSA